MNVSHRIGLAAAVVMILTLVMPSLTHAQSPFRLKRTKKETVPINVTLLAGYNGMSEPAEPYQDKFENTNLTAIGGFATGIQGMVELDTLLARIWIGGEVTYFRMYKRALYDDRGVHFIGEEWSEENPVDAIESLWGIGANAFVAIGPVWNITLIIGGGLQYHDAGIDKNLPIEGSLTEDRMIPAAMAALNVALLTYDHGSIDAQIRGLKGLGEYGSVQLQSMLAFTFAF